MRFAPLTLMIASACGGASHAPTTTAQAAPIDRLAEAALHQGAVGVSIAVMRGDQVEYARGFGFADVAKHQPVTEHSVFPLSSLSKQYWATAVLQLVEQGRLEMDWSIVGVLYTFPDQRVLVKHLLSQTSGLGHDHRGEDDITFSDVQAVSFEPGTWWRDSNRGAILARRLVEQLTGDRWDWYLRDKIAARLGLKATTTCTDTNHVRLYDGAATVSTADLAALGFVCSDALDVARFERSFDTGTLLKPASVAKMRAPTDVAGVEVEYGWFTRIADLGGHRAFGHTGNMPGVSVAAYRFPTDDLTIVVLQTGAPKPGFRSHDLVTQIAREELRLQTPAPHDRVPSDVLDAVAGTYVVGDVHMTIDVRDGRAWETTQAGGETSERALVWLGGREFATDGDLDVVRTFSPATGKATAVAAGHRLLLEWLLRRQ